jgi:predicted permease
MEWLRILLSRWNAFLHPHRLDEDLDDELQSHIDFAVEENLGHGMTEREARKAALVKFGGVTQVREIYRRRRGFPSVDTFLQDMRLAQRQIWRSPGFAIVAILTLALGIGANTAVFTLTHALLLSSLPVAAPNQLVRLAVALDSNDEDDRNAPLSLPMIQSIQQRSHSFSGILGWCVYDFVLREGGSMHGIHGAMVTGNAFEVLGVHPAAGRLLVSADDQPGGGLNGWAGVISYRAWMEKYHADPTVVGRHITVTDRAVTIVGVAPEGFEGALVAEHPDIYLPTEFDGSLNGEASLHSGGHLWLTTLARLKRETSRAQAAAEMDSIFPAVKDQTLTPAILALAEVKKSRLLVTPGRTGWSSLRLEYTRPLLLLQLLVAAVLVICCLNLSGLLLARASARRKEFALRGALGAGRPRLMRQLFVESLMLALPGALLGIALAWFAGPWILHSLGSRQAEVSLSSRPDLAVLCVTAMCALVCTVVFGVAPAWTAGHTNAEDALRSTPGNSAAGYAGARRFFIPFQVALSLTLVVVAGLLGATVMRLRTESCGYRVENVLFYITDFNRVPQKGAALVSLYRRFVTRMEELPGVEDASVAEIPPLLHWDDSNNFVAAENARNTQPSSAYENSIAAHYFSAVGTAILAGRDLRNQDADLHSCLVNQSAARLYFPHHPALGETLREFLHDFEAGTNTFKDCQIVGVVQDSKYNTLHESPRPIVYLPISKDTSRLGGLFFVIHARSLAAARAAYLTALHEVAPDSPETEPFTFTQQFSDSIAREQLLSALSGFFAVLALLLSGIGIYGLVAWNVTRRTTEIGLRMALGATRVAVFLLIMRQIATLLLIGLLAGGLTSFFVARSIRGFLFEVPAENPAIFAFAATLLALIGLVAALPPARRAVTIDPIEALRSE